MLLIQRRVLAVAISAVVSSTVIIPSIVSAQALEEIVVTAQRREQSIQDVPISLEAFSGSTLAAQGLRSMEDVSMFSPSVEIDIRTQDQDIAVRGMGTTGNNLGLEQAVPTFVDGVHYGRTSMIMGAFLDVERLEVLRGPQPIAFGQNATAGAFSITSKKPTEEWQGDVTSELGNWGRMSVEGGIGGPITDTLGIRVAGQIDRMGGYLRDVVTGDMFPDSDEKAARATLVWSPTEKFEATLKGEYSRRRRDGDGMAVCRTDGIVPQTERAVTTPGLTTFTDTKQVLAFPDDCENGFKRIGIREGQTPFFKPIAGIDQEDSNAGIIDITTIWPKVFERPDAHDDMDAYSYRIGMNYQMDNEINIDSNTAYVDYQRSSNFDNSSSPIPTNLQHRGEIFDMFSQEFRFLSARGGKFEWETGVFYQYEDLDLGNLNNLKYQTMSLRANLRQPMRFHESWQDTTWKSAFASLTWNFTEKASLDVGARYTDIKKDSYILGLASTFIFNVNPFTNDFDGNPATAMSTGNQSPDNPTIGCNVFTNWDTAVFGQAGQPCAGVTPRGPTNVANQIVDCSVAGPNQFMCGNYRAGFWTSLYNSPNNRRGVPDAWNTLAPVDIGPITVATRGQNNSNDTGPFLNEYRDDSLDPQVTLRYRFSDDLSVYAKWARAFKGGGADISSGSLPNPPETFPLLAENAENFELGAKGSLLDGAANYNITLFQVTISDLQIATTVPTGLSTQSSFSTNAGEQRTRGIEFDGRWAATDRLTLGINGALMDGVMVSFKGAGCTDAEFEEADTGPCISTAESIALFGNTSGEALIDRSGYKAPRTPDWKFVVNVDWWYPLGDRYKYMFNSTTTFRDGYIWNVEAFDEIIKYDAGVIANLNLGLGDIDDTWSVMFWGRNILETGMKYYPEFDVDPQGRVDNAISPRNWFSYGVQFQYNYN